MCRSMSGAASTRRSQSSNKLPEERYSSLKDGGPWLEDHTQLREADYALEEIALDGGERGNTNPQLADELNERYDRCLSLGWSFHKLSARLSIVEADTRARAKDAFW